MDPISNLQSPLPLQDSSLIALKGIDAFKEETSELLAMAQETALTPPTLGTQVDLKA